MEEMNTVSDKADQDGALIPAKSNQLPSHVSILTEGKKLSYQVDNFFLLKSLKFSESPS